MPHCVPTRYSYYTPSRWHPQFVKGTFDSNNLQLVNYSSISADIKWHLSRFFYPLYFTVISRDQFIAREWKGPLSTQWPTRFHRRTSSWPSSVPRADVVVAARIFKADPLGITSNHTHEDSLILKAEAPHHLPFPPPILTPMAWLWTPSSGAGRGPAGWHLLWWPPPSLTIILKHLLFYFSYPLKSRKKKEQKSLLRSQKRNSKFTNQEPKSTPHKSLSWVFKKKKFKLYSLF